MAISSAASATINAITASVIEVRNVIMSLYRYGWRRQGSLRKIVPRGYAKSGVDVPIGTNPLFAMIGCGGFSCRRMPRFVVCDQKGQKQYCSLLGARRYRRSRI